MVDVVVAAVLLLLLVVSLWTLTVGETIAGVVDADGGLVGSRTPAPIAGANVAAPVPEGIPCCTTGVVGEVFFCIAARRWATEPPGVT